MSFWGHRKGRKSLNRVRIFFSEWVDMGIPKDLEFDADSKNVNLS
jgi:hypothetical protein